MNLIKYAYNIKIYKKILNGSRVDLAMSVCPSVRLSVRMNAEISVTMGARLLRFGVQIPELLTQRKFVLAMCHSHSNAHKPPKTVAPTVLMLE